MYSKYWLLLFSLYLLFHQHRDKSFQGKGKVFCIIMYQTVSMVTALSELNVEQMIWQITCTYVAQKQKH